MSFSIIFCLFHCFHKKINKKHCIWPQYTFFPKKNHKWRVFNVFRSINGILNKTPFYKYNLCNLRKKEILQKKWLFQGFFHIFICLWKKTKKIHSLSRQLFFSLKLHKLPIFMLLSLFYDNIYFFRKRDGFPLKVVNLRKTLKKGSFIRF